MTVVQCDTKVIFFLYFGEMVELTSLGKDASSLLKINVLELFFTAMPEKNHFWLHKEAFSQRFFKEPSLPYLFIIWRTFFRQKEPFVKQKG